RPRTRTRVASSARSAVVRVEETSAFRLVESTPDAVHLANAERVLEAFALHRAAAADRFGAAFARVAFVASLARSRREEQRSFRTPASGPFAPRLESADGHGSPLFITPRRSGRTRSLTRTQPRRGLGAGTYTAPRERTRGRRTVSRSACVERDRG